MTQIIEEIVATVPGVEEITSSSSEGRSAVRVSFVWGTDIDTAAIDVQGKLEDEINELPDDIVRPRIRKFDIASFPVVLLGISSDARPRGIHGTDRSSDPLPLCPYSRCGPGGHLRAALTARFASKLDPGSDQSPPACPWIEVIEAISRCQSRSSGG